MAATRHSERGRGTSTRLALALALAAGCSNAEIDTDGPPEALFFEEHPIPAAWPSRIHLVVAESRPCALAWTLDDPTMLATVATIDRYRWASTGELLTYRRENIAFSRSAPAADFEYDDAGRLVRERWDTYVPNGGSERSAEYDYDPTGLLTARDSYVDDVLDRRGIPVYDDAGRLARYDIFAADRLSDGPWRRVHFEYDDAGKLREQTSEDGVTYPDEYRYDYDADGRLTSIERAYEDFTVRETVTLTWNGDKLASETADYVDTERIDYGYDVGGRLVRIEHRDSTRPEELWRARALYDCRL